MTTEINNEEMVTLPVSGTKVKRTLGIFDYMALTDDQRAEIDMLHEINKIKAMK